MPKVCGTGGWGGPLPGDPDNNSILTASPAFGGIELEWTYPTTNPNAVAHVRLYRNVFPVLETAVPLAIVNGNRYYDKTNSTIRYYYWMRIQSINGGPLGEAIGPASAVGRPVIQDVITQLTGMIDAGVLAESLRSDIDSIATNYGELVGEIADRLAGDAALSLALANVQAGIDQAMSFIASEVTQRQEGETALITQIDSLGAVNAAVAALVQTETNARVAADAALASQITAAQVALGEQVAGVEVALQANIDAVDGEVTAIGALYTAKVSANGLVGGFGIYNNGTEVEAGFDVDRFWVGRTGVTNRKPFIVQDSSVIMDNAFIGTASVDYLKLAGGATSVSSVVSFRGRDMTITQMAATTLSLPTNGVIAVTGGFLALTHFDFQSQRRRYMAAVHIYVLKNSAFLYNYSTDVVIVNDQYLGGTHVAFSAREFGHRYGAIAFSLPVTAVSSDVFTIQIRGETLDINYDTPNTRYVGGIENGTALVQGFYR